MEDLKDMEIENLKKQNKNLKELYELINYEVDVLTTMVEIGIPENEYMKIRQQAYLLIKEREENE